SSLRALLNLGERAVRGAEAVLGTGAGDGDPVIIGIEPEVVELMEREAQWLQQPGAGRGMRGGKPIAAHKVVDNGPVAPLGGAGWIAECRPHGLVGRII